MTEISNLQSDEQLAEKAALWVARLQSDDTNAQDQEAFERWLTEDGAHLVAFEDMKSLWSDLEDIPIPNDRLKVLTRARQNTKMAISSVVVAVGISIGAHQYGSFDRWQADYYTNVGEIRQVTLADGSKIHLNTDSAVVIHYTDVERRIELLRGEAYFDVATNKNRPFIVESESFTAKAVGTRYSVWTKNVSNGGGAQVLEGIVEVRDNKDVLQLVHNQHAKLDAQDQLKAGHSNVEQNTAWREGKLIFSNRPLAEVISTLSRYRRGKLIILGDTLGQRKVSGIFDIKNTDETLHYLEQSLSLKMTRLTDMLVIIQAK